MGRERATPRPSQSCGGRRSRTYPRGTLCVLRGWRGSWSIPNSSLAAVVCSGLSPASACAQNGCCRIELPCRARRSLGTEHKAAHFMGERKGPRRLGRSAAQVGSAGSGAIGCRDHRATQRKEHGDRYDARWRTLTRIDERPLGKLATQASTAYSMSATPGRFTNQGCSPHARQAEEKDLHRAT